MYAARSAKPKLSLSISAATNTTRPALSLRSPGPMPRTPVSPSPLSPVYAAARDFTKQTVPMYSYSNSSSAKSILKKGSASSTSSRSSGKAIHFQSTPTVYCVTPIENKDEYYGGPVKMSRDERRWGARSWSPLIERFMVSTWQPIFFKILEITNLTQTRFALSISNHRVRLRVK